LRAFEYNSEFSTRVGGLKVAEPNANPGQTGEVPFILKTWVGVIACNLLAEQLPEKPLAILKSKD
jgi:hypothetical protein